MTEHDRSQHIAPKSAYSSRYYKTLQADSVASARELVPRILKWFPGESVVDVGCGAGYWTREYGLAGCEILGIDGAQVRRDQLLFPPEKFQVRDLNQPLRLDRTFDIAQCLEVAEHLKPGRAESLIADLCHLAPVVLFSAAVPGQGGTHHINEQWQGYWIDLFSRNNYTKLDCFRSNFWNNECIAWWYRQNLFAFVHPEAMSRFPEARQACVELPTDLVHPRAYEAAAVPQSMSPRMLLEVTKAIPYFPSKIWRHFRH